MSTLKPKSKAKKSKAVKTKYVEKVVEPVEKVVEPVEYNCNICQGLFCTDDLRDLTCGTHNTHVCKPDDHTKRILLQDSVYVESDGPVICITCLKNKNEPHVSCSNCDNAFYKETFDNTCCSTGDLCHDCVCDEGLYGHECVFCDREFCKQCDPNIHERYLDDWYYCSECSTAKDKVKSFKRSSIIEAMKGELYDNNVTNIVMKYH